MNKKEIGIVIASFVILLAMLTVAGFLSSGKSPIKEGAARKRFSAAPGKTREKPLLLVSKKRQDTFTNEDGKKTDATAKIEKVYSSQLGGDDIELFDDEYKKENGENGNQTATAIPDELKQLLQAQQDSQQAPIAEIEKKLDDWMESMQSPQKKLEGLKNNLDLLLSKGLKEWVDKRIDEIISQNEGSNLTKTEAQWLMAQSKNIQGDTINAERYFQEAWQNLTTSTDIKDTEREELLRLIGLNYARFLRAQNKNSEAESIAKTIAEKLGKTTLIE